MAIHTNLPIYKVSYELFSHVTQITRNMPRDFRLSVGGEIRAECVKLMVLIFRANSATDKTPHLGALIERLQVVELLLRLSRDMRFISTAQYARAVELTSSVGKQASGWRKHSASSPVT